MQDKIDQLYIFLNENRFYNKTLQEKFYRSVITPYTTVQDKVISLLYNIANTQSQPKIDNLANFYKSILNDHDSFSSLTNFISKINSNSIVLPTMKIYMKG